jgi:hypothetical protein
MRTHTHRRPAERAFATWKTREISTHLCIRKAREEQSPTKIDWNLGISQELPRLPHSVYVRACTSTMGGWPRFDLSGIGNTVGAPFFAHFAKGGNHERLGSRVHPTITKRCSEHRRPPLQRTQGWGTLSMDGRDRNQDQRLGHPPTPTQARYASGQ